MISRGSVSRSCFQVWRSHWPKMYCRSIMPGRKNNFFGNLVDFNGRFRDSMQFTRKGDYAMRAMAYLAEAQGDNPHTIDEISERSNVPRHFLAKILKDLTRANLLVAIKGARGGYTLAKKPAD